MNLDPCTLPTPTELDLHPELGPVSLLQTNIALTIRSLLAAHPELCEWDNPPWSLQSCATVLANYLVKQLDLLSELLPEYRTAVAAEDHPFHRPGPATDTDPF